MFAKQRNKRNLKLIDTFLKHLNYFKKQEVRVRMKIFKFAEMVFFPSQQTIYSKGDDADCMYILLKGSVMIVRTKE